MKEGSLAFTTFICWVCMYFYVKEIRRNFALRKYVYILQNLFQLDQDLYSFLGTLGAK